MDFERSESGLLIPKRKSAQSKGHGRFYAFFNGGSLGAVVNGILVLIQLSTVWILWKTYQDTVIPIRQKELLSEQVAKLELERATRTNEVAIAEQSVQALNNELQARRADLIKLTAERQNLLSEATKAQKQAEVARLAEALAKSSASKAQSNLEAQQWSNYYQSAGVMLMLPRIKMIQRLSEFERAGIGAEDGKEAFHTYLEGVESIWPNMEDDARLIEKEFRSDDSKFYPRWMIDEFSVYFTKEARDLTCQKPDFVAIKEELDRKFDDAATTAKTVARKEQKERQESIDEALKRNVRIPYPDSIKEYEIKVAVSNATYKMIDEAKEPLRKSIEKCNGQFRSIGDGFFTSKNAAQQTIPRGLLN